MTAQAPIPADEAPAPYDLTLTLAGIRKHGPCEVGWRKLLAHLGKTRADDEPLTIATVYASNGFDDALWCLRALPDDRLSRHFHAWCAEQVLPIFEAERPDDARIRNQIAMLRNDVATREERDAAWDAARDAAWDAASDAARDAAWAAAWDAARDAAWAAASDAASDAASAAWDAASAAREAAPAARKAAREAAWDAAWDAARDAQERQFRRMIGLDQ